MSNERDLRQELCEKLIELGEIMNARIRNGQERDSELQKISRSICMIEKQLHDIRGNSIPSQEEGKCPNCLNETKQGTIFCGECGTNIKEYYEKTTEFCSVCNGLVKKEDIHCGICGSKLNKTEVLTV